MTKPAIKQESFEVAEFGWNFIKNLRSGRYTTASLINELVDNSDDASAKKVWIDLVAKRGESNKISEIVVADNGNGMDFETLKGSFKIGFTRPNRTTKQNGKFGMGGTVGCLSVCTNKLVITRHKSGVWARYYDLAEVKQRDAWGSNHVEVDKEMVETLNSYLGKDSTGTVIILRGLDRLTNSSKSNVRDQLVRDIGLTYCEKLDTGLEISINGNKITPYNPLLWDNPNTIKLHDQKITGTNIRIRVVSVENLAVSDEPKRGRMTRSGGYIFRNDRLIEKSIFKSERWPSLWDKAQNRRDCRWALYFTADEDNIMQVSNSKDQVNPKQNFTDKVSSVVKEYADALANKRDRRDVVPTVEETKTHIAELEGVMEELVEELVSTMEEQEEVTNVEETADNVVSVNSHIRSTPQNYKTKVTSADLLKYGPTSMIQKLLPPHNEEHGYEFTINCAHPFNVHHYNQQTAETRKAVEIILCSLQLAKLRTPNNDGDQVDELFALFDRTVQTLVKKWK